MAPMEEFIEMLKSHNRIVFFGGAGVSTESDIPDFRGKGGLYRQKTELPWSPEEMLSHHFLCGASRGIFHPLQRKRRHDAGSGTEPGAYGAGGIGENGEIIRCRNAEY